jgi:hypothetical protein
MPPLFAAGGAGRADARVAGGLHIDQVDASAADGDPEPGGWWRRSCLPEPPRVARVDARQAAIAGRHLHNIRNIRNVAGRRVTLGVVLR